MRLNDVLGFGNYVFPPNKIDDQNSLVKQD